MRQVTHFSLLQLPRVQVASVFSKCRWHGEALRERRKPKRLKKRQD
ncbi:unnamed protein product [Nezara viridula]|uniref:Uncharacterized protein n=1 Tax=Nezara viridula TaxID=85310 RepID=A0A9P0HKV7_NEZVI|nr:unnamed protein product [Nezara viridula]